MTTTLRPGPTSWSMTRDQDGHRDYKVTFRVEGDPADGPATVLQTPGLPVPGSVWQIDNDNDQWAFCRQPATVTPLMKGEANTQWDVEITFTTKNDDKRCKDQQIEDPLTIPPRVSGTFQKYQEEATEDRFGIGITNSSWEQFRGPQVEFDKNRPSIKIELNTASFIVVALAYAMLDHVNQFPLWGFAKRCIKLSSGSFNVKYYGQCFKYYELSMEFDIRNETFDRDLLDEGTKVLHGHWDGNNWALDNIGGLAIPLKPSLTAVNTPGGTLVVGNTYGYRVTSRIASGGGETLASPEASILLTAGNNSVKVTWPAVPGAKAYGFFGRTVGAELFIDERLTPDFVDLGNIAPVGALPVVDTSGGVAPDRFNPQHFDQFKDRNGENCKVILNGAGLPAGVIANGSGYFVCIVSTSTGVPTTNTTNWLFLNGPQEPEVYQLGKQYAAGNLVILFQEFVFIALTVTTASPPGNGSSNANWLRLPDGANKAGVFDTTVGYVKGDIVQSPSENGSIHIEKYDEADFLLLGIPTQF